MSGSTSVQEVLITSKIELRKHEYELKLEFCEISHIMTRKGRNFT